MVAHTINAVLRRPRQEGCYQFETEFQVNLNYTVKLYLKETKTKLSLPPFPPSQTNKETPLAEHSKITFSCSYAYIFLEK